MDAAFDLMAQGLLTKLPASLITAALVALCAWMARRRAKK